MDNIKDLQDAATAGNLQRILSGQEDNVHLRYLHGQIHHRLIQVISSQHKGSFKTLQEFMEQQLNNAQIVQTTQRLVVKQLKLDYEQAMMDCVEIVTVPDELYRQRFKPHLTLDNVWRSTLEWILISHRMGFAVGDMHDTSDASESLHSVLPKNEMARILYSLPEQDRERKLKDILALTRGIRIFKFYLHGKPVHAHLEETLRTIYDSCRSGVVQNEVIYPLFRKLSHEFVQVEYQLMCMLLDGVVANLQHAASADQRLLGGKVDAASKKNETSSVFALNKIDSGKQNTIINDRGVGVQTDTHPPNGSVKRLYYGWQKLSTDSLSNCNDDIKNAAKEALTINKVTIKTIPQSANSASATGRKTTTTMAIGTDESVPSSPILSDSAAEKSLKIAVPILATVQKESKQSSAEGDSARNERSTTRASEGATLPRIAITTETSTDPETSSTSVSATQSLQEATQSGRKSSFKPANDFEIPQAKQYSEWEYRAQALRLAKMQIMRHTETQSVETTFKRETNDQTWVDGKQSWTQTRRDSSVGSARFVRAKNGHVLIFEV